MITDISAARSRQASDLLNSAAALIRRDGYNPSRPADPGPGYSVSTAICTAAGCDPGGRHTDHCEALHGRVAGYLYLTGRVTTGIPRPYLPDVVAAWESFRPGEGWRTQAEAAGILARAAAIAAESVTGSSPPACAAR